MTRTDRTNFLDLRFNRLTFNDVKRVLRAARSDSRYGYIVTPNVDHIIRVDREPGLRALYDAAELCVCDSRILRLLARLRGLRLPLVPGSDLAAALLAELVEPSDRIALIGGSARSFDRLRSSYPDVTFVHYQAPMGLRSNPEARRSAAAFIAGEHARFTLIAVGSPQQEMIANEVHAFPEATGKALCIGAGIEFLTGEQKRAPRLVQKLGFEWAHRLASNPRRLWRRYLVDGVRIFPIYARWRNPAGNWVRTGAAVALFSLAAGTLLGVLFGAVKYGDGYRFGSVVTELPPARLSGALPLNLPAPDLLRPLTPDQAASENAARPFAQRPDSAASKFVLHTDVDDRDRATTCLAQAVYYEAAGEGVDGGRAVAQVVLNRLRHPGYPASVCGVVYQGSERPSGCQFTFTCDGSLQRIPVPALWARSRKIAEEALAGRVFAPVGHATHYHADYVLPYWADSLDKSVQIARHIFYRLRGALGDGRSFFQHYAGSEPRVREPGAAIVLPPSAETEQLANALASDSAKGAMAEVEKANAPTVALAADATLGTLISDGQSSAAPGHKPRSSNGCDVTGDRKQLAPLGANDMRAGSASPGC